AGLRIVGSCTGMHAMAGCRSVRVSAPQQSMRVATRTELISSTPRFARSGEPCSLSIPSVDAAMPRIQTLLVANRSEIAIRVMRAAAEMGIRTVAVYSHEDRFSLHRFKADESYQVADGKKPLQAYFAIEAIMRLARLASSDAIHPGYGIGSENPEYARACKKAGIRFVGPSREVMTTLGNKVSARNAVVSAGVPVMPATPPLP